MSELVLFFSGLIAVLALLATLLRGVDMWAMLLAAASLSAAIICIVDNLPLAQVVVTLGQYALLGFVTGSCVRMRSAIVRPLRFVTASLFGSSNI